ncbi:MAG: PrsW family intramembrane metalloprotease [Clostridiales bacterium]|nr:PrsW family intramembrane metalloprotease [Clostridiales bacterium]
MIYTENIFVCLAAPLVIASFLLKGGARRFTGFFALGLTACLLSAYVNSFFVAALIDNGRASLTMAEAIMRVTPVCEEVMKALPVFLFMALAEPRRGDLIPVAFAVGLGFATFENCCYITQYGAGDFLFALVRGFSAGVMHTICAAILAYGLAHIHGRDRLVMPCAFALLCASSTFHSIYNIMSASYGAWLTIGYMMPLVTAAAIVLWPKYSIVIFKSNDN